MITSFRITFDSPSSSSSESNTIELENSQTRQHSISLSNLSLPSPSSRHHHQQITVEPIYRIDSGGGPVRVSIETSSRRAEGLNSPSTNHIDDDVQTTGGNSSSSSKFECTLKRGLNTLEFRVRELFSTTNLEGEVYRIFILK